MAQRNTAPFLYKKEKEKAYEKKKSDGSSGGSRDVCPGRDERAGRGADRGTDQ